MASALHAESPQFDPGQSHLRLLFLAWRGSLRTRIFCARGPRPTSACACTGSPRQASASPVWPWLATKARKKKKKPTHGLCSSGRFPGPVYRARHRQLQRIPARSWLGTYWPQKRRSRLTNKNDQHTNPHSILWPRRTLEKFLLPQNCNPAAKCTSSSLSTRPKRTSKSQQRWERQIKHQQGK